MDILGCPYVFYVWSDMTFKVYLNTYCDDIDLKSCTRRIVSANIRATDMMVHFLQSFLKGIELVNIISAIPLSSISREAGSLIMA